MEKKLQMISLPKYSLGEELFNSISHGLGALLGLAALVLMAVRARSASAMVSVCLFGLAMVQLYAVSCVYHGLSPRLLGKKILRVIDHCNVYLLVLGTYIPVSLLGVGGVRGWLLLGLVCLCTALGVVCTAVNVDRYQLVSVICHLLSGWSILLGLPQLLAHVGLPGLVWMVLGGVMYSIGAVLYGLGKRKKYRHCVFHIFCLLGTFCHFWAIYVYLL